MRPASRFPRLFCTFLLLALVAHVSAAQRTAARPAPASQNKIRMMSSFSTSSFLGFVRCPAERGACTDPWASVPMDTIDSTDTAYFRDVVVGALTFISGASDGETWGATFTDPKNTPFTFGNIQFLANYNGQQNCFVSPFWYICGSNSIEILWYLQSQCLNTGSWKADFSNTTIGTRTFKLMPQIKEDQIGLQRQTDYTDAYDSICRTGTQRDVFHCANPPRPNQRPWRIAGKGCYLTDLAMILSYHGVAVDPATLNTYLIGHAGYTNLGDVLPQVAMRYASDHGVRIQFPAPSVGALPRNICTYGPQLGHVINRGHWVTAYGQNEALTQYLVRDPDGGTLTSLPGFSTTRLFSGPQFNFTDALCGIRFDFHSPVELYVTDPQGRRAGYDPVSGAVYNEIPNASYDPELGIEDAETGEPPEDFGRSLEVYGDVDGQYTLTVTGTATGSYTAEMWSFDLGGNYPKNELGPIPTSPGEVHTYLIDFHKADATQTHLGGGFDGGGQRPRDVNRFLSYGNLSSNQVTLPAGTATFPLFIFYDTAILPASFNAVLDGVDVTNLFHPTPGGRESVSLPLVSGRNVLKLSVDGQLPSRTATDTDRLVLQVP
jgi:hypothetical protein